jgi:hypothetical protein
MRREIRPTRGEPQPVPAREKPKKTKNRRQGWTEPPEVAAESEIETAEVEAEFVCPFHSTEEIAAMSERKLDRLCRLCCFVHLCGRGGPL